MAITSDSTVVATFKVSVTGSDTKQHSLTFPNAKTTIVMNQAEAMEGTAALFGAENMDYATHDVTNRTKFKYVAD